MKVILFGLTGLGNVVLEALMKNKVDVIRLSSRKETGRFPYFRCENIIKRAKQYNIPSHIDKIYFKEKCDIIISATFHKKIDLDKCNYNLAVNMHPSLLPYLKGKDPIMEALNKKIKKLGLTTHKLTNIYDSGEYLFREKINFNFKNSKKDVITKLIPLYEKHTTKLLKYYKENYEV